jgi:hypothetical protein
MSIANFRLVKGENSAQNIPIYKVQTFICKNMYDNLWIMSTKYNYHH